ncbi:hypothetical protein N9L47_10240 [Rhodobacteraceae bacterium]|nr:hypothetical protein [Paracoccaceae bacterium]
MTPIIAGFYLIPSALAIILGYKATSKAARTLLLIAGCTSLLVFALLQIPYGDCSYNEFAFVDCTRLPDRIAEVMGVVHFIYALAYLFAGPVLLVLAALFEMLARLRT